MPIRFKPYHRGEPDSRDVPDFTSDDSYAFTCPVCNEDYVHVIGVRMVEGPYDSRPCAEIALDCEHGCKSTAIFGNYKGSGYCHYVEGYEWLDNKLAPIIPEAEKTVFEKLHNAQQIEKGCTLTAEDVYMLWETLGEGLANAETNYTAWVYRLKEAQRIRTRQN